MYIAQIIFNLLLLLLIGCSGKNNLSLHFCNNASIIRDRKIINDKNYIFTTLIYLIDEFRYNEIEFTQLNKLTCEFINKNNLDSLQQLSIIYYKKSSITNFKSLNDNYYTTSEYSDLNDLIATYSWYYNIDCPIDSRQKILAINHNGSIKHQAKHYTFDCEIK